MSQEEEGKTGGRLIITETGQFIGVDLNKSFLKGLFSSPVFFLSEEDWLHWPVGGRRELCLHPGVLMGSLRQGRISSHDVRRVSTSRLCVMHASGASWELD